MILQNRLLLVLTLSLVLGVFSVSEVYAETDYNAIKFESTSTVLFERSDSNIIVSTIYFTNNDNEEFSSFGNSFQLVSSESYFDDVSSSAIDVGSKVCPSMDDVPAGVSKEFILLPFFNFLYGAFPIIRTDPFKLVNSSFLDESKQKITIMKIIIKIIFCFIIF